MGKTIDKKHAQTKNLFLRGLGGIYLIAFLSLLPQIKGLIGADGILPANTYLTSIENKLGFLKGFSALPSIFWIDASDFSLITVSLIGALASLFIIFNIASSWSLITAWFLYLSLMNVSRVFLGYQWDILLLEVGFLSIFMAFMPSSKALLWLFRFLLFKLMFMSGAVKLLSGDALWRDFTALNVHYETQPIPNILSWHAHHLPEWLDKISVFIMFIIELILPFLVFGKRQARLIAFAGFNFLQLLIIATGNYCFFNLLAILLSLLLLDDKHLAILPNKIQELCASKAKIFNEDYNPLLQNESKLEQLSHKARKLTVIALVIFLSILHFSYMGTRLIKGFKSPAIIQPMISFAHPFRVASSYGLFASMTKPRNEIIIEGSYDGKKWEAYEFKWKPGKLDRSPAQIAPYQPRLDWQMWFAALRPLKQTGNNWFLNFISKLLEGSEDVTKLLEINPFKEKPPKYIRAKFYEYHFSTPKAKKLTGDYWVREYKGMYMGPVNLNN